MNPIQQSLQRILTALPKIVKTAMDQVPHELAVFTKEFLIDPSNKTGQVKAKSGNLYYKLRNTTSHLRTLYGNLTRALEPHGKGNITETSVQGSVFTVDYGIDESVNVRAGNKTVPLIYPKIHENKGRPFLKPGMELFMKDPNGFKAIMDELEERLVKLA